MGTIRQKPGLLLLGIAVVLGAFCLTIFDTSAAPLAQLTPFPTPTPGPDGRIIYIVQANDTILRISLISGVTIDELRGLNNLLDDVIVPGQELLLGLGGPSAATPTPGPSPTPTQAIPTASPEPGLAILCVLVYNDINGDAIRQEEETSIAKSAISVNDRLGAISLTATTVSGLDPHCFNDLPEGEYNITVAIPDGYNSTTVSSYVLKIQAGDETYLDFGAQANSETQADAPISTEEGRSPLLGIIGGIFLVAGAAVAVFASRFFKSK
jgi:hypothetical protein